MEYVIALIAMINPKKKQKEASKPKDDVDESSKKKGKKQGKGGKKGKQVEEEEEVEKEEKEEVYLDVFMKVTDFGGPLFKPHDRIVYCRISCRKAAETISTWNEDGNLPTAGNDHFTINLRKRMYCSCFTCID